ncbi:MAG: GC-type dockerin domain-anchored protein [Phycisphaerales bacterium]
MLLAGTAAANPVPWFNIGGNTASRGLYGEGTNTVLITPSLPAGGPFTYLEVSGTLTEVVSATFMCEAAIEVTMPSGQRFVSKPFDVIGGASGTTNSVVIPLSNAFGSGGATLRFFELYRDSTTGPDSNWSNLTFTLHNAAGGDVPPLDASIAAIPEGPDVSGVFAATCTKGVASAAQAVSFPSSRVASKARVRGYGTCLNGWNASNSNSQLSYVTINITAQKADGSGPVTWSTTPFAQYAASSAQFDVTVNAPVPVLAGPGADWSFTLTEPGTATAAAGTDIARVWMAFQPLRGDAPATTDLGTIRSRPALGPVDSTPVSSTTFTRAANEVKWYTFNTEQPCSDASGFWLDIHSQIPAGSTIADHEMGVYSPDGFRLANDDDGGSNTRSQLSFGQTSPTRPPVDPSGGPAARNGHNGTLPAGQHYLAVSVFNTEFAGSDWYVYSTSAAVGDINFEFRTNLPPLIPPFTDLGTLGGSLPAPASTTLVNIGDVKWFRFDVPQPIDNVTRYYLDIDTISPATSFDTMLGLYNSDGVVVGVDDDDGGSLRTQLSYGIGPANRPSILGSAQGDGRDGNLNAGRYYVALASYSTAFGNEWVANGNPAFYTGNAELNLRHNFPSAGCGPADLGSAGGAAGADGLLNNNDFIAFITYFFGSDPHADLGMAGGVVGSDGLYNNNDFIAFITLFFNGCP